MKKRERCPVIFHVRQSFTTAYLGKQTGTSKKHVETYSDYINVANRGTNVETGNQPIRVTLSYKSYLEGDDESSFRKEHFKSEGVVVVHLKGTKTVFHYIVRVEN